MKYKTYPKMKESGVEWIGKIPEKWEIMRLKYLGKSITGLTYSPNDVVSEGTNGTLVLRATNIRDRTLSLRDTVFLKSKIPTELHTQEGDILICSRSGSKHLVGKNITISKDIVGITFGAFMTVFRSEFNNYISKILNSRIFSEQTSLFMTTTINQLTLHTLNNLYIPFPKNTDERSKIVYFLDKETSKIDSDIQKNQKLLELLKEKRQNTINHAVTKGLDRTVPMKNSGIEWIGEIPEHWKKSKYKFLTSRVIVGIAEGSTNSYVDDGIPLIRSTNVRPNYIRTDDLIFINYEFAQRNASKSLKENDILTVRTGYPGISAIVPKELNNSQCFTLLISTPGKEQFPNFLCNWLNSDIAKSIFKVEGWGAAQINISVSILQNIPIFEPPFEEQKQIVDYLDKKTKTIDLLISKVELQIKQLLEFRESLISSAVTGKICITN